MRLESYCNRNEKHKVATQFITELFAVTLIAIVIGTSIGSAISVPVTNSLLANQIESAEASFNAINENFGFSKDTNVNVGSNKMPGSRPGTTSISYIDSISSATNLTVVLQLIAVGILLTIISGLAALISIMRYEPLKILSSQILGGEYNEYFKIRKYTLFNMMVIKKQVLKDINFEFEKEKYMQL